MYPVSECCFNNKFFFEFVLLFKYRNSKNNKWKMTEIKIKKKRNAKKKYWQTSNWKYVYKRKSLFYSSWNVFLKMIKIMPSIQYLLLYIEALYTNTRVSSKSWLKRYKQQRWTAHRHTHIYILMTHRFQVIRKSYPIFTFMYHVMDIISALLNMV